MIIPNEKGLIKCPNCKKEYKPILKRQTDKLIQIEFPKATTIQREQLISGLCSQKCWDLFLGIGEERIK
jgi:hypothetical protein